MDLSTTYLGLKLPHPIMPGASPMVDKIDLVMLLSHHAPRGTLNFRSISAPLP